MPDFVVKFDTASGAKTIYRLFSDQLGSPRLAVNINSRTVIPYRADYSAFGIATAIGTTDLAWIPFGFAGGLYDKETGLVRFGARDYDPTVGRWVSKDPIRFGGGQANLYAYVGNDPINSHDPLGLAGPAGGAGKTFGKWLLPPPLDKIADAAEYCIDYPEVCATAAQLACEAAIILPIASAFESPDAMEGRLRDSQADEINRHMFQDAAGTQSQDTLSGGESVDPYLGGMSVAGN